jgi:hypothetical protein
MDDYSSDKADDWRLNHRFLFRHLRRGRAGDELLLARREALAGLDVFLHRRQSVSNRPAADLYEAGSGAVHPGLGQPGQGHAKELGDLHWVQQGIDFVGLRGGTHGLLPFLGYSLSNWWRNRAARMDISMTTRPCRGSTFGNQCEGLPLRINPGISEKFVLDECAAWAIPFALAAHTDI